MNHPVRDASELHYCAKTGELPEEIRELVGRCEVGEKRFSNDEVSLALSFGERLWGELVELAELYEKPPFSGQLASDIRSVLSTVASEL